MFIEAKDDGGGGDYWSYKSCEAPVKSLPPTNQHPVCFTGRIPFLSPNQQCQSTEGKISLSMDLLTPSSPGGFPTFSLTTNSSRLPWREGLPGISIEYIYNLLDSYGASKVDDVGCDVMILY